MSRAPRNGEFVAAVRAAARQAVARGIVPVPVRYRTKNPNLMDEWEKLTLDGLDLDKLFPPGEHRNIGMLNGEPSGGRVDVDLDCVEARFAARYLLPPTGMIWGRRSASDSHHGYLVDDPPEKATEKYSDPVLGPNRTKRSVLVELRSTGGQTLVPPSVAPGDPDEDKIEEPVIWSQDGEPTRLPITELRAAVGRCAAAALLARHWPAKGARHDAALALAGGLIRLGWPDESAEQFIRAVCTAAGDENIENDRAITVGYTRERVNEGKRTTGWLTVGKLLGENGPRVVRQVCEWLGANRADADTDGPGVTFGSAAADPTPPAPEWPDPPNEAAYHGLVGDIVRAIEPASEADPVALLTQCLVYFGNVIGRSAHFVVEADRHYGNEFMVLVAQSSKGRKGTSRGRIHHLFAQAEQEWADNRAMSGLSSGEGLIWNVRDPIEKQEKVKERGEAPRYETVVADPGEPDKRLLVYEPEYANVLKQTERQGNTLSTVIRQAWESDSLRTMTKNSPARSTGAHVSIIGHITADELTRYLSTTEAANGFGNRFMWFLGRRSKLLPEGGRVDAGVMGGVQSRLASAIAFARTVGEVRRDDEARELWAGVYGQLSEGRPGLAGNLLGRAEAHTMRLALLYALLDQSPVIRADHLLAAVALWDYCERSVLFVFGDLLGDPLADDILRLIRQAGQRGVTRTDISTYLGKNVSSDKINRALGILAQHRLARAEKDESEGRGRPVERWYAARAK
jgi:hypothetical protein